MLPRLLFIVATLNVLLTDSLERVVGAEPASSAATVSQQVQRQRQGRNRKTRAQRQGNPSSTTGCLLSQCFIEQYAECFHKTSFECVNLLHGEFSATRVTPPPTPRPIVPVTQAEPPTPNPSPRPVIQTPTQTKRTHIFEIPILVRLLNVEEDYILSASDRTRFLSIIQWVLDEALDDPWKIMRVAYLGEYVGERRRLQSSLRRRNSIRRLNKTLYLPVLVTLRGEGDSSDIAWTVSFILQVMRNNLNVLLARFKSLDPNAFRNLQLSVEELNLANVASTSKPTEGIQSTDAVTNTQTNEETTTSTSSSSNEVAPFWVWLIVAAVCICICFVIFMCMCRKCCVKSRNRVTKDDEYQIPNQLAVLYGNYGNSNGDRKQQYLGNSRRENVMVHSLRRSRSEGASRRSSGKRRQSDRKVRRSSDGDGYISSGDVDMNRLSRRRSSTSVEQERALAVLPPRQASFSATSATKTDALPPRRASFDDANIATPRRRQSKDLPPAIEYQGQEYALVVYDAAQTQRSFEPEGLNIEEMMSKSSSVRDTLEPVGPRIEDVKPKSSDHPPRRASFCATSATKTDTLPHRRASFDEANIVVHKTRKEMKVEDVSREKPRRNHRHITPNKLDEEIMIMGKTLTNRSKKAQFQDTKKRESFVTINTLYKPQKTGPRVGNRAE